MREKVQTLVLEIETALEKINSEQTDPLQLAKDSKNVLLIGFERLRLLVIKNEFACKDDEIYFFKTIKPSIMGKLFFFREYEDIELKKPLGTEAMVQEFYEKQLCRINDFFDENRSFYKYIRTKSTDRDDAFFVLYKFENALASDSGNCGFNIDPRFSSSHDELMARILCNELLIAHLKDAIRNCNDTALSLDLKMRLKPVLKWTGSKVSMVELIYGMHECGAINNGNGDLKSIVSTFEHMFGLNLHDYARIFFDIRSRKMEPLKFFKVMEEALAKRLQEED